MTAAQTVRRPKRLARRAQRLVHLVAAPPVMALVYLGPDAPVGLTASVRWVAVPVLVASGMVMWQGPRMRRRLARKRSR